ncbi:MAG: DUF4214 domain-containing protein, partial [Acidobacteria bacterium]|nr:DUF4214 domain-containing protein [Acidobacteriota bacterium]
SVSNDLVVTTSGGTAATTNELLSASAVRIADVVSTIQQAYMDFSSEQGFYEAAPRIETALTTAFTHASFSNTLAGQSLMAEAKTSLQKAIGQLEWADVLMQYGNVQNPIDYAQYFVRGHYNDFFGREPDEAGRSYWTSKITECGSDRACIEARRVDVSAAYFLSIEFRETGYLSYRLRLATSGQTVRFNEFLADTQELGKGVTVGKPGWVEQLAANKKAFLQSWVQREEFRARYDALNDYWFVSVIFTDMMHVTPTPAERDALVAELQSGGARADILAKIVDHPEFSRQELNKAFVLMQYFGYMRRDPDEGGFRFWLKKLNDNNGDYNRAQMVKAFIDSIEYRERFKQP